jgi:hypothetical protein
MSRGVLRQYDINESYYLLLELCNNEPLVQQCFSIIDNICLSHGISMSGKKPTTGFQRHMDQYYIPFLRTAIKAMHTYGFVPWRLMKLNSGDLIPEVLPPMTFRWTVEMPNEENSKYCKNYKDSMLIYVVKVVPGARQEEEIFVTQWIPPNNVSENSLLYATVPSPMSGIIESYKNLISAQKRQSHADAWNCTARIVVGNDPKEFVHDQHRRELFETFHKHIDEFGRLQPFRSNPDVDKLHDTFQHNSRNHIPSVYQLPNHHHLEQAPELKPVIDISMLHTKYKIDVCSLTGVPPEMVTSVNFNENKSSKSGTQQGTSTNRMFQAKMQNVCNFLKTLMKEVYVAIYRSEDCEFEIIPMPRMEINSIEDLKILHEIGVLQPEHTVDLASILIGRLKKMKKNTSGFGQVLQKDENVSKVTQNKNEKK